MAAPRQRQPMSPTNRLLGASPAIVALRAQLQHLTRFDTLGHPAVPTLLLQGETGTGKGLVARVAHDSGPRAAGPFVEVNCAALPETMLEAELFGFEAGAFTDAKRAKAGLFEAASGGTLFLDEIDALPLGLQGKLLTALEAKRVRRLGAVAERTVDVKLIAATNADLSQRMRTGQFRADLYHRLAVVVLTLPPLRERADDVWLLAQTLLDELTTTHGVPPKRLEPDAMQWLQRYAWPGNVRELRHVLERVTLLHAGESLTAQTLEHWCPEMRAVVQLSPPVAAVPEAPLPVALEAGTPAVSEAAAQIREALVRTGGNLARAARLLGMSRDQLRVRMRRYGVSRPALPALDARPIAAPAPAPTLQDVAASDPFQDEDVEPTAPAVPAEVAPPPVLERRHLTVLYGKLTYAKGPQGSLDIEVEAALRQASYQMCEDVIARFGGYLAQYLHDGVLVYFGYPQAQEGDAIRAARAALAFLEAVQPLQPADGSATLEVRLGLHTGLMAIQADAADAPQDVVSMGDTLATAMRVQTLARPGTVLCSAVTASLIAGYMRVECLETPPRRAGDVPQPVYRIVGATGARNRLEAAGTRPLTPLVGRDPEMALLRERWLQVRHGLGQVVLVWGEAGIGKSRLLQELREQVVGDEALCIVCQGMPEHQQSPFAPVLQHLQRLLGGHPGVPPAAQLHALEQALAALDLPLSEVVPPLAALLSLPLPESYPPETLHPAQQKQRSIAVLLRWLVQQATRQPVLLMVDDLHWIDPSTHELLNELLDQAPSVPLYLVGTCRPDSPISWPTRTYLTHLTLTRLAPTQVTAMVTAVADGKYLQPAVVDRIVQQTDGIPLFIEELTKMIVESGPLSLEHDPLRPPAASLAVPATLQDSLMARLDHLGSAKAVAQLGATLGREFAYALLRAVAPQDEATLAQELARLREAELLYQRGVPPQATYRFKHALIQEAAYQSLSIHTRQQYHRAIAQALTVQWPESVASQPEILAQHYTAADMVISAVDAWLRAGQRAAARAAYVEAAAHCTRGLALLRTLPESTERQHQALTFYLTLGGALQATKGFAAAEVTEVYAQAQALCQRLAAHPELSNVWFSLWLVYTARGEHRTAQETGLRLLGMAHDLDDVLIRLRAYGALGLTALYMGEFTSAWTYAQEGFALTEHAQDVHGVFTSMGDLRLVYCLMAAWALQHLGFADQAQQWAQEVLAQAQRHVSAFDRCNALSFLALVYAFRREWAVVQSAIESALELATAQGFALYALLGAIVLGAAWGAQERGAEGLEQIHRALVDYQTFGTQSLQPFGLAMFAETAGRLDQPEADLAALDKAQALMATTEERFYAAEIARLQGTLLLQAGHAAPAAETCFQQALDIARGQQAKWWELRAAVSLARLWQHQGKRAEARQLLGDVYGWFTEGFDLADLREAHDLLQALA